MAATPRDLWIAVDAARYVANGALGFVYESSRYRTALPLFPILLAPLIAAGDALRLSEPPAPPATMYFLLTPFTLGLAIPLLHQARGLLRDAGDRGPALSVQVWTALLVGAPVLVVCGHGEDALALLAMVAAVRLAIRERWATAALMLGSRSPPSSGRCSPFRRSWRWVPPPAAADGRGRPRAPGGARLADPRRRLGPCGAGAAAPAQLSGFGHAALWVDAGAATVATAPFRLAALALAVALAGCVRPGSGGSRLLAVLGLTLLARCAFEPVVHVYYLAPGCACCSCTSRGHRPLRPHGGPRRPAGLVVPRTSRSGAVVGGHGPARWGGRLPGRARGRHRDRLRDPRSRPPGGARSG